MLARLKGAGTVGQTGCPSLDTVLKDVGRVLRRGNLDWQVPRRSRNRRLPPRLAQRIANVLGQYVPVRITTRRKGRSEISYRDDSCPPTVGSSDASYDALHAPSLVVPCQEGIMEVAPPQQNWLMWRGRYQTMLPFDAVTRGLGDFVVDENNKSVFILEDEEDQVTLTGVSCTLGELTTDPVAQVYGTMLRAGLKAAGLDADDEASPGEYLHRIVSDVCRRDVRGAVARRELPVPRLARLTLNFPGSTSHQVARWARGASVDLYVESPDCKLDMQVVANSGRGVLRPLREVVDRLYASNRSVSHADATVLGGLGIRL